MYEVEFVGRGGQGAKTASEILARAALKKGLYVQSFPDYGPERKGAPVRAFTRTSTEPIRGCSSEANPDVIVVIDPTLLSLNGTFFKLTDKTILVANTAQKSEEIQKILNFKGKVYTLDATRIALENFKIPITNTPMLAAFSKATNIISKEELEAEIVEEFGKKIDSEMIKKNMSCVDQAFKEVN
jgi:pyruvate ferredoxin oxidoreductase gamma subunit